MVVVVVVVDAGGAVVAVVSSLFGTVSGVGIFIDSLRG